MLRRAAVTWIMMTGWRFSMENFGIPSWPLSPVSYRRTSSAS